MPRLKKTEAQRRAELFQELYRVGKARFKLTDEQVGCAVDLHRTTVCNTAKTPEKFKFGTVIEIGKTLGWTDEEFLSIIHAEK